MTKWIAARARAKFLGGMIFSAVFILINGTANATCDDFGKHSSPEATIISPLIDDLPFGKFIWGTEAYPKNGIWWTNHYVLNSNGAPPLAISWVKAGIDRSILNPLQGGQPFCQSHFVGAVIKQPVPDPDAPIVYHVDRHIDAVIYTKDLGQSGVPPADTPGKSGAAPAGTSGQPGAAPADKSGRTGTRIETTITTPKGELEPISFELGMKRDGNNIQLSLKSSGSFRLGLPGFATILGMPNTEQIRADLKAQGIGTTLAPLYKFADSASLRALFWNNNAPLDIENRDTLFFDGWNKEGEASRLSRIQPSKSSQDSC